MDLSEVFRLFRQETIEDPWPVLMELLFLRGVKELWYWFLIETLNSSGRFRAINPNFPRFHDSFYEFSRTLYIPINETTFDALLRKIYGKDEKREVYSYFLRDLGVILQQTQQGMISAQSRRALNDVCKNALENLEKLHSRFYNTLELLRWR